MNVKKIIVLAFSFIDVLFLFSQNNPGIHGSGLIKKSIIDTVPFAVVSKYAYPVSREKGVVEFGGYSARRFFLMHGKNDEVIYLWEDQASNTIFMSRISGDLQGISMIPLKKMLQSKLLAACMDNSGNVIYVTVLERLGAGAMLEMRKADNYGRESITRSYDCSATGLNIWNQDGYMADLAFNNGNICLLIARRMFKSSDGLNHQGGIACLFNAKSLELIKNFGQTSGHSFDNFLTTSSDDGFLAIDLGDNYPRGVNLHHFLDGKNMRSRVVYTFKTAHGTSPGYSGLFNHPPYNEISTGSRQYYKWSNDNQTYTELGGVLETGDSYMVFFIGEPDPNGKSLNNSRISESRLDPGNIGLVIVKKDYAEADYSSPNVVTDDVILSKGIVETGGFYDFGGKWNPQRNTGVIWLTKYIGNSLSSISNLKVCGLPGDRILLLWRNKSKTSCLMVNSKGKAISKIIELDGSISLNRRDELLMHGNRVLIPMANQAEQSIELVSLDLFPTD